MLIEILLISEMLLLLYYTGLTVGWKILLTQSKTYCRPDKSLTLAIDLVLDSNWLGMATTITGIERSLSGDVGTA